MVDPSQEFQHNMIRCITVGKFEFLSPGFLSSATQQQSKFPFVSPSRPPPTWHGCSRTSSLHQRTPFVSPSPSRCCTIPALAREHPSPHLRLPSSSSQQRPRNSPTEQRQHERPISAPLLRPVLPMAIAKPPASLLPTAAMAEGTSTSIAGVGAPGRPRAQQGPT